MINRYVATCGHCQNEFIFRAVVPHAKTESLRFCCPFCAVELSAAINLDLSVPVMNLAPVGFALRPWIDEQLRAVVTVSTDLPVHREKHVLPLPDGGSPFLLMSTELGPSFLEWIAKVHALQELRDAAFVKVKVLVDRTRAGDWVRVRQILEKDFSEKFPEPLSEDAVIYRCYRVLNLLYVPLMTIEAAADTLQEYFQYLNDCISTKMPQYAQLLKLWSRDNEFRSFRFRVLTVLTRVLKNFDAFVAGLLIQEMPAALQERIDEFRIYRDDWNVVKSLYQDLFELVSQALLFFGAVINLSKRGDPWHYVIGINSYKQFKKAKAYERLKILEETPRIARVLGAVSRPMRNTIGHFAAEYEPCTGNIRYEDGSTLNYLAFLGEFFVAVKALWMILAMVEKFDLDMCRFLRDSAAV